MPEPWAIIVTPPFVSPAAPKSLATAQLGAAVGTVMTTNMSATTGVDPGLSTDINPFPKTFSQNASNWQRLVVVLKSQGII